MADEKLIALGNRARGLLANEDFTAFVEAQRIEAFQGWSSTQPEQGKEREEFYYLLLATDKLTAKLTSLEQSGRFEQHRLDTEEADAKADAENKGE